MTAPLLGATLAADPWGVPGGVFLAGYLVLVVLVAALVFRAPTRLDATTATPVADLRAVDLAFLADGDRLTVTSALASLRAAELIDDDARTTPPGHLDAGEPGDPVQVALLGALRRAGDGPSARRLSTLLIRPEVYRAVREVEAGLRGRGLLRGPAEHRAARRWSLLMWVVTALGVARVAALAVDRQPYGWVLLLTGVALLVAAGTSVGGAVASNRAAGATLAHARATHRGITTELRATWPDHRRADVGLAVALFGWRTLTAAMRPLARAVVADEVFDPHTGETSAAN